MLALWQLVRQVEALALYAAMKAARLGQIPWTPELVREHNRDWLRRYAPHVSARWPTATQEGLCPCGALCLLIGLDDHGLIHRCAACGRTYLAEWHCYSTVAVPPGVDGAVEP